MADGLTLREQYRHPEWQRKRLEVLQRAGFKCEGCGAADQQLHVHHKRYVKGRMVWEYDSDELDALCEGCHEEEHAIKSLLEELFARADVGFSARKAVLGIVAGYLYGDYAISKDLAERAAALTSKCDLEIGIFALVAGRRGIQGRLRALAGMLHGSELTAMETGLIESLDDQLQAGGGEA